MQGSCGGRVSSCIAALGGESLACGTIWLSVALLLGAACSKLLEGLQLHQILMRHRPQTMHGLLN